MVCAMAPSSCSSRPEREWGLATGSYHRQLVVPKLSQTPVQDVPFVSFVQFAR